MMGAAELPRSQQPRLCALDERLCSYFISPSGEALRSSPFRRRGLIIVLLRRDFTRVDMPAGHAAFYQQRYQISAISRYRSRGRCPSLGDFHIIYGARVGCRPAMLLGCHEREDIVPTCLPPRPPGSTSDDDDNFLTMR